MKAAKRTASRSLSANRRASTRRGVKIPENFVNCALPNSQEPPQRNSSRNDLREIILDLVRQTRLRGERLRQGRGLVARRFGPGCFRAECWNILPQNIFRKHLFRDLPPIFRVSFQELRTGLAYEVPISCSEASSTGVARDHELWGTDCKLFPTK